MTTMLCKQTTHASVYFLSHNMRFWVANGLMLLLGFIDELSARHSDCYKFMLYNGLCIALRRLRGKIYVILMYKAPTSK